jgi:hypothetical protein
MVLYDFLIIDAQNLYWRAVMSSIKKCLDKENFEIYSNSIRDFLDKINGLESKFGTNKCSIYLLFDNPTSIINKRKKIDIEYKHTREEKNVPKNFYKTLDMLQEILKIYNNNLHIVKCDGLEADDLVYYVLQEINIEFKDKDKLIISADMDWARAMGVDEKCYWYNHAETFDALKFKNKYTFSPAGKKIQMYKAIHGDDSDAIPNAVPYLPKEILLDIIDNYKNPDELFSNLSKYPEKWKLKIKEAEKRIITNYQLTDYCLDGNLENCIFKCSEDTNMLRFWFNLAGIQFETRMYDDREDLFFEKPKYRRIKK